MTIAYDKEEKRILRARLAKLGISSSPNASLTTLRAKYEEACSENTEPEEFDSTSVRPISEIVKETEKEATKLIRLRIKNLNPAKRDLHGEIYTIANSVLGKISKYIPYDEAGESYHVPNCIYKLLKSKKFLQVRTYKDPVTKAQRIEQMWIPEFSLEELPQLTQEELKDLAIKQQAQEHYEV